MSELTEADCRILSALRVDSRISNADLAEKAGLSPSSCWRRVRALESNGVIRRYTVDLDDTARGLAFSAILHVQLTRHDQKLVRDFITAIRNKEEVRACYATTGAFDYHLHVVCAGLEAFNRFLEQFLFTQPAVASAQTNLVLQTIKG